MIITYGNFKGGTGKTTLCAMEGVRLAKLGYRVLLIDLDYQMNLTQLYASKYNVPYRGSSIHNIIKGKPVSSNIVKIGENLDLVPASLDIPHNISDNFLLNKLPTTEYDYILIDTRPDLNNLVLGAVKVSDLVRVVIEPTKVSLNGAINFYNHISKPVELLINKFTKKDEWFINILPKEFTYKIIPYSDRLKRYSSEGVPDTLDIYDKRVLINLNNVMEDNNGINRDKED